MPKKGDPNSPKNKKKHAKKQESDDDSSSDYDPQKDELEDMNTLEMQKLMQKIFPSKNGKERLKQLEKLDILMDKNKNKKVKNKKNKQRKKKKNRTASGNSNNSSHDEEVSEKDSDSNTEDNTEEEEIYDEEYLEEDEMEEFMKNNMKFNIIFSVPQGGMGCDEFEDYDNMEEYGESYESSNEESEKSNEENSDEEKCEEEKKYDKKKKLKKSRLEKLKKKPTDEISEEEFMDLMEEQEKQLKKDGEFYNTKYNKNDKVLVKLKGWNDFKKGKVSRVHKRSKRMRAKYDVTLEKKYKGKKIHKGLLSRNLKPYSSEQKKEDNTEDSLLRELKQLIDAKKEGSDVLQKKFDELAKVKEKKDEKKKKKKEERRKRKNFFELRKLLREKNVMNDFKYFKTLELDVQEKIITKLKDINSFSNIEKPYRISLIESDIPVEFKSYAMKKVNTLEYMDPSSGEYYKNKQWVDTFMRIPFNKHSRLPISIKDGEEKCQEFIENAKNILDKAVYGLEDAKLQILQMIGQWISNPDAVGTAIAVKGPPGTGKTTLIKEGVSKILNRPFAFLALGGATDSSFLEGHSYTYEGSHWGKIVDILINCKCMNPVFYFDELDKISQTPKGEEIVGILTHMTDTSQNDKFHDKYFANVDFDLSKSMFIFSYNEESKVNPILKDRMYRIQTDGYKTDDKWVIAKDYLIPKIEQNVNFEKEQIIIPQETISYICNNLTNKEKGVRNLKRCLEIIYTKLNLYRLMKRGSVLFDKKEIITVEFPFTVTQDIVDKLIKKTKEDGVPFGMYV